MSKKLNNINNLCAKCIHKCKQSAEKHLLVCPHFERIPQQLTIKFSYAGEKSK